MAEQESVVQEGIDRVRGTVDSIEEGVERVQKDLRARRRLIEKRFDAGRKDIEKRFDAGRKDIEKRFDAGRKDIDKRARKLRKDLRKDPRVKQLESWGRYATRQLEQGFDTVLSTLQIARKNDVQRIDRKLGQISRKLKEIERTRRTNGGAESAQ